MAPAADFARGGRPGGTDHGDGGRRSAVKGRRRRRETRLPMRARMSCPGCGCALLVREEEIGQKGRCPHCKAEFVLRSEPAGQSRRRGPSADSSRSAGLYAAFYGFTLMPFGVTPDTRFFFPSSRHTEALASLIYTVTERKGFALLTGEIGSGKTTGSIFTGLSC